MASNGWRASLWWRHRLRPGVGFMAGCLLAVLVWSIFRYVPGKKLSMILLGITPFAARYLLPSTLKPDAEKLSLGLAYGSVCMARAYFLGGKLDRREIVATKSFCQVLSHFMKLIYFGSIIDNAATVDKTMMTIAVTASIVGTTAARRILEAMNDKQFRVWAARAITSLLLAPLLWRAL
jgi:hypothetical protein